MSLVTADEEWYLNRLPQSIVFKYSNTQTLQEGSGSALKHSKMPSYQRSHRSRHYEEPRDPNRHQAWVTRVNSDDPRMCTGIRYYPETDIFVMPAKRGREGTYEGPREIPGREFLQRYPGGNAADLRRRRLDELRSTGKLESRQRDRFGNPWPADRYDQSSMRAGQDSSGSSRRAHPSNAYSVSLPDIPEDFEPERAPLFLAQGPHWGNSSRHPSRHSGRRSSHATNTGSRRG